MWKVPLSDRDVDVSKGKEAPGATKEIVPAADELPDVLWKFISAVVVGRSAWRVSSASLAPSAYSFANDLPQIRDLAKKIKAKALEQAESKLLERTGSAGS